MNTYEYTVDGAIHTVDADTYRTVGEETVFLERWRNPATGDSEREVLRVKVDEGSIIRLKV